MLSFFQYILSFCYHVLGAARYAGSSPTSAERFCDVAVSYIRMFRALKIVPVFVIDGQKLPSKSTTDADRLR